MHPALKKLQARQQIAGDSLVAKHKVAQKLIQASAISSLLLLSQPNRAFLPSGTVKKKLNQEGFSQEQELQNKIANQIRPLIPNQPGKITPENSQQIQEIIEHLLGIKSQPTLDGHELNHSFGWIGYEQHLKRFPKDNLSYHQQEIKAGIAPGLGAWGYFAASQSSLETEDIQNEQYYVAVQTMYTPDWNQNANSLRKWYKYRKVIVVNPDNGKAVVAVIADAGPARWTGKQFGGSPEVMAHLELDAGMRRGKVLLWFVKDNPPIGPLDHHTHIDKPTLI